MLNFVIAILGNTFSKFQPQTNGLYLCVLISQFAHLEFDDNYGCITCSQMLFIQLDLKISLPIALFEYCWWWLLYWYWLDHSKYIHCTLLISAKCDSFHHLVHLGQCYSHSICLSLSNMGAFLRNLWSINVQKILWTHWHMGGIYLCWSNHHVGLFDYRNIRFLCQPLYKAWYRWRKAKAKIISRIDKTTGIYLRLFHQIT